jgi:isoquinoline 1-oxidoreductase
MGITNSGLTRREFLGLTGGLIIYFSLPHGLAAEAGQAEAEDLNAWLHIAPDSRVTVFTGKVEIGQGARTSLAQMAAEELTVPFSSVEMVMGDTDQVPYDGGTYGSLTIRTNGVRVRAAAAQAREVLMDMAAEKWSVSRKALVIANGRISLASDPHTSITLGELTQGKRIAREMRGEPRLRPVSEYRVVGKSMPRVDGRALVTGEEKFVGDLRLPGMVYGAVLYPPSFGAHLVSINSQAAEKLPGVIKVVREADFVGVVAAWPDVAEKAVALIKAAWKEQATQPSMATLYDDFRRTAQLEDTVAEDGEVGAALASARRGFSASYRTAYLAHAPLEPHAAVAWVRGERATVYSSTQTPFPHRDEVAAALRLAPRQVRVLVPRVGGGFGGRENADVAIAAARLSRAVGRPVMVTQSRAEEMTWNYFKPAALIDIRCGVNEAGQIQSWDCDIYNCGDRGALPPYQFANRRVRSYRCDSPLRQGAWRGLAGSANTFAIEAHMDHVASQLGQDPVEFRLRHLGSDSRLARTIEAAAEEYRWRPHRAPTGLGVGFACGIDAGSCVAEIAEVEVDRDSGLVRVRRIVVAHESGLIINPDGIRNQIEGGVTMGLGLALRESVRYEQGHILTTSYSTYPIPTIKDTPQIDIVLVQNPTHPPQGAGEPPIFPIGALIADAVFDATGKRLRELPLSPDRVLAALQS